MANLLLYLHQEKWIFCEKQHLYLMCCLYLIIDVNSLRFPWKAAIFWQLPCLSDLVKYSQQIHNSTIRRVHFEAVTNLITKHQSQLLQTHNWGIILWVIFTADMFLKYENDVKPLFLSDATSLTLSEEIVSFPHWWRIRNLLGADTSKHHGEKWNMEHHN